MSVNLYNYTHINSIYHGLVADDDFILFIKKLSYGTYTADINSFGRMMWYLYVANCVAYSLQYKEEVDIFSKEVKADKYDVISFNEAAAGYGGIIYNIYTNDGNYFLGEPWYSLANIINEYLEPARKKYYNEDFYK